VRRASPGISSERGTGERSKTPSACTALTVLHDDADYRTVARHAPDLSEHNIRDAT
jgi:hypothetical protein